MSCVDAASRGKGSSLPARSRALPGRRCPGRACQEGDILRLLYFVFFFFYKVGGLDVKQGKVDALLCENGVVSGV